MANISVGLREKVKGLHTFAELFGFDWEDDSDWTWTDVARAMADEIDAEEAELLEDIDTLFNKVDEYSEWHCDIADMLDVEIDISDMSNAPTDWEIQARVMMALRSLKRNAERVGEAESRWVYAQKDAERYKSENEEMRYLIDRLWKIVGGSKDEYEGIGTVAEIMELAPRVGKLGIE